MATLKYDFAHGWAFGFYRIRITSTGIMFDYKIPQMPQMATGFQMCWQKPQRLIHLETDEKLVKRAQKIVYIIRCLEMEAI
jgi:hypothetical protein